MLNQHEHVGLEEYCERCGERWDDRVHGVEDKHYRHMIAPPKLRSWDHKLTVFFVLTFSAAAVTVYDIWAGRWDRATYFLVLLLELLRLWGKYESKR